MTRLAALLAGLLLAGCASPTPRYHALVAVPGPVRAAPPRVVMVRRIAVPRYLERDEIVTSSADGRVRVAENDWWSERLGSIVQRVLAADLAQRLPAEQVLGTESLGGEDVTVELAVERFEPVGDGTVALDGFLALGPSGRGRILRRVAERVTLSGTGIDAQVAAMSQALAIAADTAAVELARP